jgi:hypothetical protein
MTSGARANSHHVAVGFCILALGILLVLDRLGIVGAEHTLRYWPVGLIIIGASVMLQAFRGEPTTRNSVPWGAIFWLFILGIVLSQVFERRASARDEQRGDTTIFAVLSGASRTPHGTFKQGDITTMMGGARLDLRSVDAKPGDRIVVDVFTLMGGAVIYIPNDWAVDVQAMSLMGGIDDQRRGWARGGVGRLGNGDDGDTNAGLTAEINTEPKTETEPAPAAAPPAAPSGDKVEAETPPTTPPTLVVRGYVTMGGLQIRSK